MSLLAVYPMGRLVDSGDLGMVDGPGINFAVALSETPQRKKKTKSTSSHKNLTLNLASNYQSRFTYFNSDPKNWL